MKSLFVKDMREPCKDIMRGVQFRYCVWNAYYYYCIGKINGGRVRFYYSDAEPINDFPISWDLQVVPSLDRLINSKMLPCIYFDIDIARGALDFMSDDEPIQLVFKPIRMRIRKKKLAIDGKFIIDQFTNGKINSSLEFPIKAECNATCRVRKFIQDRQMT